MTDREKALLKEGIKLGKTVERAKIRRALLRADGIGSAVEAAQVVDGMKDGD